jgi:hypothetical protein
MLNGNIYGLIITMLTFVIAVVLTMRQVEQTGVQVVFTIRPVTAAKLNTVAELRPEDAEAGQRTPKDDFLAQRLAR